MKTLLIVLMVLSVLPVSAQHPDDYRWDDRFGAPGIVNTTTGTFSSPINSIAIDTSHIYVGGEFTSAGNSIAAWNRVTKKWQQLGSGITGKVRAIVVIGDNVYVGGLFTKAGDVAAGNIAVWHKSTGQWSALDKGVNGEVLTMAVFKGELHIGGLFTAAGDSTMNKIARWTGREWKSLGKGTSCGVLFGQVTSLATFQNVLWVGGTFDAAGGIATGERLAVWNGNAWSVPPGITSQPWKGQVVSMAVAGSKLFVSGSWDSLKINSLPPVRTSNGLLSYDGNVWDTPIQSFGNYTITPILASSGQNLYIANAQLREVNGILANGIARWNASTNTWASLGSGLNQTTLVGSLAASETDVIIGGSIIEAGGQYVNNVALFDLQRTTWNPLASSFTLGLLPTAVRTDPLIADAGGLVAIGDFQFAGDTRVNGFARWDGTKWQPIGTGFDGQFQGRYVQSGSISIGFKMSINAVRQNGKSYIIAGDFSGIGTTKAVCLAEYNEGVISPIGGGLAGPYSPSSSSPGYLSAKTILLDSNDMYVGGTFQNAGSISANNIAQWNGSAWSALGGGVTLSNSTSFPAVNAIAKAPNGDIYIGGDFDTAGGISVDGIARWDGKQWHNVGQTIPDETKMVVYAMAFIGNDLYVGGTFRRVNGVLAPSIAKWDGQSWSSVGNGLGSKNGFIYVTSFAVKGDDLYVGGIFDVAGDVAARNIAVWNVRTNTWSALGSGVTKGTNGGQVNSIVIVRDTVFCGGFIDNAGGKPSFNIAAWLPAKPNSVECIGSSVTTSKLAITPNPASSAATLTFAIPQTEQVTITLRDALGREVLRISESELPAGEYQTQIDCSTLAGGAYYCVLSTPHSTRTQLLVINR
ncbi:MAG: T9SS type A sorting domain-containing protein [Candidatus Kapaibacterium sp.]